MLGGVNAGGYTREKQRYVERVGGREQDGIGLLSAREQDGIA